MAKPSIHVTSASSKRQEIWGMVTVGEEHAKVLSKALKREVQPGEQFELGLLAVYDKSPFTRWWRTLRIKRHLFN